VTIYEGVAIAMLCVQQIELMFMLVLVMFTYKRAGMALKLGHALTDSHYDLTRAVKQRARISDTKHEELEQDIVKMRGRRA
jgi:hypothetical protein